MLGKVAMPRKHEVILFVKLKRLSHKVRNDTTVSWAKHCSAMKEILLQAETVDEMKQSAGKVKEL